MSTSQYIILAIILIVLAAAGRLYRLHVKNRWKGLNDFGVACVDTDQKVCALTFDDGPDPDQTPRILDTLHRHGIRATFFVLGSSARHHPDLIRRMAAEGHDIGNHTAHHVRLSHSTGPKTLREIGETQDVIKAITGETPQLIRPPHGRFSREQEEIVRQQFGFSQHYAITWDICTYDWEAPSKECLVNLVDEELRPGSIILFHDVQPSTADHLEDVIRRIKEKGFSIIPVSDLLTKGTPKKMRE